MSFDAQRFVSVRSLAESHISPPGARMKDVFTLGTIFCNKTLLLVTSIEELRSELETVFSKESGSLEET
jgi:hypothetical protein